MNKLYICIGLPASGKTTWARKFVTEKPKERVRVNRDDIRRMLGVYWIPSREKLVTEIENDMIISSLDKNYDVVVDATNLRGTQRFERIIHENFVDNLTHVPYIKMEVKDFTDVPLDTCLIRDKHRPKEEQVGEEAIIRMYNKYLKK